MLKIPEEYDRDILSTKFKDISCQFSASLLGICAATRELWWINHEWLELRWRCRIDQKMAAVHRMLCMVSPHNSNQ
jgi:hypothetical protein